MSVVNYLWKAAIQSLGSESVVVLVQPAQSLAAKDLAGAFDDASENQQIEHAPGGRTTNTLEFRKSAGSRCQTYRRADFCRVRKES